MRSGNGLAEVPQGFASAPPPTGDWRRFDGNIDFNEIVEGIAAYLPIEQPGIPSRVGDWHAVRGGGNERLRSRDVQVANGQSR